jgi:hypothetical protein
MTVDSYLDVMPRLQKYGICIVTNYTHIFHKECTPNEEQRDYILRVPQGDTDDLLKGRPFPTYSATLLYTGPTTLE